MDVRSDISKQKTEPKINNTILLPYFERRHKENGATFTGQPLGDLPTLNHFQASPPFFSPFLLHRFRQGKIGGEAFKYSLRVKNWETLDI